MAQLELFTAFVAGFISSYGLLLFATRGKEFPPGIERDVYLSYAIGAAVGVGTALLRLAAVSSVTLGAGGNLSTILLMLSPMLATLDIMPVYIYLNRKAFIGKPQALYVSLSMALGVAAMEITFKVFRTLSAEGFLTYWKGPLSLTLFLLASLFIRSALGADLGLSAVFPSSMKALLRPWLYMSLFNFFISFYQVDFRLWPMTALALLLAFLYLRNSGLRLSRLKRKLKRLERKYYS